MSSGLLNVVVQDLSGDAGTPTADQIEAWVTAAVAGRVGGEITVRVVTKRESASLNERYRGRAGPTNVLAFPADAEWPDAESESLPVGDLAICAELVSREAVEQGKPLTAHWTHVVIHGTLHLLGFDHETEPEAELMEQHERELLAGFGIPDPYTA